MKKKLFTKPVTVVVSDSTYQQIEALTTQLEISVSEWIRNAISKKLEKQSESESQSSKSV
jgi:hypothetical protein